MPRESDRLRVEMVLPSLIAAGMEMVTARLSLRLLERGCMVGITCIVEEGNLADRLRSAGVHVAAVPEPGFATNLWPRHLERWFRKVRPDVVHVHSGAWIKGAHAARQAGVRRVVFTEHGLLAEEPWYSNLLKRWGAFYTDRVAAVSIPLAAHLRRAGVPSRKLSIVINGVDVDTFAPQRRTGSLRRELGIGEAPVVGHVARLAPEKNQRLLLDALRLVHMCNPAVHLVIIGDGPLRDALREHSRKLPRHTQVHFLGVRHDMADLYREFDAFVLSSDAEGTSMSVLEAMASGIGIVATAVGGTPDLLAGGACGELVPPADANSMASALVRLLGDSQRREALAAAARQRAVDTFSEQRMVDAYLELYGVAGLTVRAPESDPCAA